MSDSRLRSDTRSIQDLLNDTALGRLYAVLDPCGSETVLEKVLTLGWKRCRCLFGRSVLEDYWAVAPYFVKVDADLVRWLVAHVWDEPWGILVVAQCDVEKIYAHLQQLLRVEDPGGEVLYFRFYDPRVLEFLLPTCTEKQLNLMYGPADAFGIKTDRHLGELRPIYRRCVPTDYGGGPSILKISKQQISSIRKLSQPNAIKELTQWLISDAPQLEQRSDLVSCVEVAVSEAEELGLASTSDVHVYTYLRVVHGFDLSADPDLRSALETVDVPAHNRLMAFVLRKPPTFWRRSALFDASKEAS